MCELKNLMQFKRDNIEFEEYVSVLLKLGYLQGDKVIGIGKQIVTKGSSSLTENQSKCFIKYGLHEGNYIETCVMCSHTIPWCEKLDALDDGFCSHCRHLLEKG